ncbi:hypothetical protein GCM10023088_83020 [Actinomadura verrucosospora]|uniref:hypothetical protein n=1 Tax=Actinomadura verrucosospora TaxID=46165 RepID=UPI0031F06F00
MSITVSPRLIRRLPFAPADRWQVRRARGRPGAGQSSSGAMHLEFFSALARGREPNLPKARIFSQSAIEVR